MNDVFHIRVVIHHREGSVHIFEDHRHVGSRVEAEPRPHRASGYDEMASEASVFELNLCNDIVSTQHDSKTRVFFSSPLQ